MAKNNKDEEQKKPNIVVNPNIGEEVQQQPTPNEDEAIALTNGTDTAGKIATHPNTAMQGGFTPTPQTTPSNEPIKPTTPTAAPAEQATPATPAKSATRQLIDDINAKSEEERQRIERRRQAEETISGIADMGKALSNLYFTGKGAPNMYDAKTAMTPKARERYERALRNWEKNRAESMQYALSKQKADLAEESNRLKERQLNDLADYRAEEQRRKQEQLDFTKAQKEVENALKEEGLNVRERIARMNNATRQMSISQRSTLISPYKKVKQKVRDPQTGEVSEIEYRFTVDPITGEIKGEELRDVNNGNTKTKPAAGKSGVSWQSSSKLNTSTSSTNTNQKQTGVKWN